MAEPVELSNIDMNRVLFDGGESDADSTTPTVPNDTAVEDEVDTPEPVDDEASEDDNDTTPQPADEDELEDVDGDEEEDVDEDGSEDGVDEPLPLIKEIQQTLGFETDNEYEDSVEGLTEYFRDSSEQYAEQQLDRVFKEFPLVQALLEYQLNGGDQEAFVQTFFGQADYSNLEIGEKDYAVQERILGDELRLRGYSDEEIIEEIEEAKSSDRLKKKADRALEILRKNQKESQKQLLEEQKEQAEAARQEQLKLQRKAKDLIKNSNDLRGLPLPEKDKLAFEDYLFKTNAEGQTQYAQDLSEASMDIELAAAYLMFRDFDLSGLISRRASTKEAKSLRDRINKNKTPNQSGSQPNKDVSVNDPQEVVDRIDFAQVTG